MVKMNRVLPNACAATEIAAQGFVQPISKELYTDVKNHLSGGEIVFSIEDDGEIVGFTIFQTFGDILYLSGIILVPGFQGKSIGGMAIQHAQAETNTHFLALRTQSARMWSVGNKLCQEWYPNDNGNPLPEDVTQRSKLVGEQINSQFPITEGYYNGPLYGEKPTHRDQQIQKWWDSICNFERGDAILCIGRF